MKYKKIFRLNSMGTDFAHGKMTLGGSYFCLGIRFPFYIKALKKKKKARCSFPLPRKKERNKIFFFLFPKEKKKKVMWEKINMEEKYTIFLFFFFILSFFSATRLFSIFHFRICDRVFDVRAPHYPCSSV